MIDLNDVDIDRDVRMVVDIDDQHLTDEYSSVAHHLAVWGERYARAQEGYLRAKLGREHREARLRLTLREEWEADPANKRCTEAQLDAMVKAHAEYAAAKVTEIEAEAQSLRARGVLGALRTKADMLVSLGAAQRAEMRA
jgi:hypothetical protein